MRTFILIRELAVNKYPHTALDQIMGISRYNGKIVFVRSKTFPITAKAVGRIFLCDLVEYQRFYIAWILRGATLEEEAHFIVENKYEIVTFRLNQFRGHFARNPVHRNYPNLDHNLTIVVDSLSFETEYRYTLYIAVGRYEFHRLFFDYYDYGYHSRPEREVYLLVYYKTLKKDRWDVTYKLCFGTLIPESLAREVECVKRVLPLEESVFEKYDICVTVNYDDEITYPFEESIFENYY